MLQLGIALASIRGMTYRIEVHAIGYEDTSLVVNAPSLREAKRSERHAIIVWCDYNDIDLDSNFNLPFTRTTKVSDPIPLH